MPCMPFIPSFPCVTCLCPCSLRPEGAHAPGMNPEAETRAGVSMLQVAAPGLGVLSAVGRHVSCSQQRTWEARQQELLSAVPLLLSCLCAKGSFYSQHFGI